jgi:hypothetical protein
VRILPSMSIKTHKFDSARQHDAVFSVVHSRLHLQLLHPQACIRLVEALQLCVFHIFPPHLPSSTSLQISCLLVLTLGSHLPRLSYFVLSYQGIKLSWWGNDINATTFDGKSVSWKTVAKGGHFWTRTWRVLDGAHYFFRFFSLLIIQSWKNKV